MSCLPHRAPRLRLEGAAPAVLRFQDGQRTAGKLHVVSLTGGLLSLANPIVQGSQVKLMFLTRTGSVLGGAEMLSPLDSEMQPFRFVSLAAADQRRLGATIQASSQQDTEERWIEKFRAASAQRRQPRKQVFKLVAGVVGLAALALVGAIYFFHFQWLK